MPKVLITNSDPELMDAALIVFTSSMHLINQNFVLQAIRDVLFPFKKRIDFDFNMVNAKVEEAIVESDQINFQRCEAEISDLTLVLEQPVKDELNRIFQLRVKWALPYFNKSLFTGGLHANERATFIEGFIRM